MSTVSVENLSVSYEFFRPEVLSDLNFTIDSGSITGLLGRNGCGKSTLSLTIAGLLAPKTGHVLIDGTEVYEDASAMANVSYMGDEPCIFDDAKLKDTLTLWSDTRPHWDGDFAAELLDTFLLSPKKKPNKLSRGQKSAFYATLGLASRCPVTIFDEVHLGMDAVAREIFYRTLLSDYTRHPRTIILSSHLIEEIENLLDHVIFLDGGRLLDAGDVDDIRTKYAAPETAASSEEGETIPRLTDILMELTLTDAQREALGKETTR